MNRKQSVHVSDEAGISGGHWEVLKDVFFPHDWRLEEFSVPCAGGLQSVTLLHIWKSQRNLCCLTGKRKTFCIGFYQSICRITAAIPHKRQHGWQGTLSHWGTSPLGHTLGSWACWTLCWGAGPRKLLLLVQFSYRLWQNGLNLLIHLFLSKENILFRELPASSLL